MYDIDPRDLEWLSPSQPVGGGRGVNWPLIVALLLALLVTIKLVAGL